ncbi:hypothetical protein GCM10017621_33510 [Maricaulis virginensis]|uniref:DUF2975 domain-containing protein n=1 Tax=Maricaulis virginensis TaxID=144022 RepID=A0A9W6IPI5_9PROT|nr:hypothetical protein GCM10017621_33510 [Maricaulis virginensis]
MQFVIDKAPAAHRNDARIRGLSRFLAVATLVLMALQPLVVWGAWMLPDLSGMLERPVPGNGLGGPSLDWFILPVRLGAAGIATVPVVITLYGLLRLRGLFTECAQGRYFSAEAVTGFRQFALASLVNALWAPAGHTVMGVYLSVANPHVPNALEIAFSSRDVQAIGLALLFFLVAHILAEGRRKQEELELIL